MAKVINPLLSGTASGQFGQMMTFDKRGYVRKYVIPANPQSVAQMTVRNRMGDIQRELKMLGTTMRVDVRAALGARWNSLIIGEITANDGAKWDDLEVAFTAFGATPKTNWGTADPATGLVNTAGLVFYIVAKALYDVCLRIGGDGLITEPIESTFTTNAGEWVA